VIKDGFSGIVACHETFFSAIVQFFCPHVLPVADRGSRDSLCDGSAGFAFFNGSGVRINGVYVGDADYDTGETFSGSVSFDSDSVLLEGEVAYQKNEIDSWGSGVSVLSFMANGYPAFRKNVRAVVPYVSAGLSFASIDAEYPGNHGDHAVIALRLGAGVGIQVAPAVRLDARYRYFSVADPEFDDGGTIREIDIDCHNVLAGLRLTF